VAVSDGRGSRGVIVPLGSEGEEPEEDDDQIDGGEGVRPGGVEGHVVPDRGVGAAEVGTDVDDAIEGKAAGDVAHEIRCDGDAQRPGEEEEHQEREEELGAVHGDRRVCGQQRCGEGCGGGRDAEDGDRDEDIAASPAVAGVDEVDENLDGYGCLDQQIEQGEIAIERVVGGWADVAEDEKENRGPQKIETDQAGEDGEAPGDVAREESAEESELQCKADDPDQRVDGALGQLRDEVGKGVHGVSMSQSVKMRED
jgi:hypothetical protein